MENRNKKVMLLSGLIVGVLLLSIGFAAFANNLTISATANVTPNSADFRVVFSNAIDDEDDEDPVTPTKTPNTITATSASINNTTSPTLSNISVSFTEPGQKAVYNLYVYNAGKYIANLNSVTFKGTKSCTPGTGADSTMVASACNSITMTVKVGSTTYSETTNNITGKTLGIGQGEAVQVTVGYAQNGAIADGPFTVTFSDISLYYSSVGGVNEPIIVQKPCTHTDTDSDGDYDLGEVVTCGTEQFYIVSDTNDTVTMLTKYNLDAGYYYDNGSFVPIANPTYMQTSSARGFYRHDIDDGDDYGENDIGITVTDYCEDADEDGNIDEEEECWFEGDGSTNLYGVIDFISSECDFEEEFDYEEDARYYTFTCDNYTFDLFRTDYVTYNSYSNLYQPVQNYVSNLTSMGLSGVSATIPTEAQYISISSQSWATSTSYWLGTSEYLGDYSLNFIIQGYGYPPFIAGIGFYEETYTGIRPLVTISKSNF